MNRDKGTVYPCGDPSRSMGQKLGPFIHLMYEDGKSINKKNNLVARVGKPGSSSAVAAGFWHMAPIILKALCRQGLGGGGVHCRAGGIRATASGPGGSFCSLQNGYSSDSAVVKYATRVAFNTLNLWVITKINHIMFY
ncbi:hypothetical protein D3C79_512110 [compost metagenome]